MSEQVPDHVGFTYSNKLHFPMQLADSRQQRVFIAWRGVPLASPIELEVIAPGSSILIDSSWMENKSPFLKLRHPEKSYAVVDYVVRWTTKLNDIAYALLQLAPDWPGQDVSDRQVLVRVSGDRVVTLSEDEYLKGMLVVKEDVASRKVWHPSEAQSLFSLPDRDSLNYQRLQAQRLREDRHNNGLPILCFKCEKPVQENDNFCAHCGVMRSAPLCPHCNNPVSDNRDERIEFTNENGYYPWHFGWSYQCNGCGFDFYQTRITFDNGHSSFFNQERIKEFGQPDGYFAGRTTMEIRAGESLFLAFDAWDYQPTVVVTFKRLQEANREGDGNLVNESTLVLTPGEWNALVTQLNGPLKPLLHRQPWSRDTT